MAVSKQTKSFGLAVCEHLGLDAKLVLRVDLSNELNQITHFKINIAVTADDLASIAKIMQEQKS